ncbi:uncharacterized protein Z518_05075 [Rhinocladiella mackenziei CBS 650.93]|uniref:Acyltransferase 3 domain-containing protein n=1 Tax=Rhinocladiella mackenziei CBS 650.93 TaxID=1442369 RepID=A0A0D2H9D7_9EURO|nr:uncharacterized protein Z518_05075 [Rhinocladiella mackenziei CBS 650.93]KIX07098.1 hypothetical protein Z518_05075 [Rhinocladiella mackenziei CBS 650.93]
MYRSKAIQSLPTKHDESALGELDDVGMQRSKHSDIRRRGQPARRADLDNLRTFLTALVVVHHTAIPYGGLGSWKFHSKCFPPLSLALVAFNGIDQTFFMGAFFFLSGWFSGLGISHGVQRGSQKPFLRSRLVRLTVPALVYTIFIDPLINVILDGFGPDGFVGENEWSHSLALSTSIFWTSWINFTGIRGPVWYSALLACFDVIASLLSSTPTSKWSDLFRNTSSNLGPWLASILLSFVIRLPYPVGTKFWPLNVQPAFVPQYILAYVLGQASQAAQNPYIYLPFRVSRRPLTHLFRSLSCSAMSLGLVLYISAALTPDPDPMAAVHSLAGGFSLPALLYAIWNEVSFAAIMPALITLFSQRFNSSWTLKIGNNKVVNLPRYSYAAFLLHPLVSLIIELSLENIMGCSSPESASMIRILGPILMTLSVGLLNIAASWIAAYLLVEYVPYIGMVI